MNPETLLKEVYEVGERSKLNDRQRRNLVHSAYWHGVSLAKLNGIPQTASVDNRAIELAFLKGFEENRKYREGATT